jgi:aspartyl-tRNA(Asn)/glutamyl-tRNA(Gln) amidotransferase subunit A
MSNATLQELSAQLAAKACSSVELAQDFLNKINELNKHLGCYITVDAARTLAQARAADARRAAGQAGLLTGVPLAHKDIFCAKGWLTTCGSKMLANFVAPYDAHVVERCDAAGMVTLGKTNMDEFAMGSSNETSFFGPVRNPWNREMVPGYRYWWFDSPTRCFDRYLRPEADLRAGLAFRHDCVCIQSGSGRTDGAYC